MARIPAFRVPTRRFVVLHVLMVSLLWLSAACGGSETAIPTEQPMIIADISPTLTPTDTPEQTATSVSMPTETPTEEPSPTPEPTPEPTATLAPELGTVQQSENGNTQVMTESGWQDLVHGHVVLNGQPYTYENERLVPIAFPGSLASSINSGEISIASVGEVEQASGPQAAFFDAEGNMVAYWSEWRGDYVQSRFIRENGTIIDVVPSDKIKELNDLEALKANPESVPILVLPSTSLMPPQDGSPIDTGTMFIAYSSETAVGYNLMGVRPLRVALETWDYLINNTPYSVPVMRLSFAYRVDNEEVKTGEFVYSSIAQNMPGTRYTEFGSLYNRIDDAKVVVGGIAILPFGYSDFKELMGTDFYRDSLPLDEMSYTEFQSLLSEGNFVLGDFDDGSNQFWPTRIDLTYAR